MPIVLPARVRPFAPDQRTLFENPKSNLIGCWGPEKGGANIYTPGTWDATLQATAKVGDGGDLGRAINGTNYWLQVGNTTDWQDWWIAFSFITVVGENFAGHMWGRGTPNGTGDWSVLTDVQKDSVSMAVVSNSIETPSVTLTHHAAGSRGGPVAVGIIYPGSGSGTMYAIGRDGRYASATGPSSSLRIGTIGWNFGAIADTGGESSAVRPVGALYGTAFWNRAMPLSEMQQRLALIQRTLDGC